MHNKEEKAQVEEEEYETTEEEIKSMQPWAKELPEPPEPAWGKERFYPRVSRESFPTLDFRLWPLQL